MRHHRSVTLVILGLFNAGLVHAQPDADPQKIPEAGKGAPGPWTLKPPTVSGYLQVHYRHAFATDGNGVTDHPDFRVQRVRVQIEGEVTPWASYQVEMDPRAPEVAGVLRDAFIALSFIPRHQIRIGQQKMQFGYENRTSSRNLFVVNRAELSDALSRGANLRDVGLGLIGNLKLGKGFRLEDALTVGNGVGLNPQADDTAAKNFWGRVGLRYKRESFVSRLGISGGTGDLIELGDPLLMTTDQRIEFKRLGADLQLDHKWLFLAAEYVAGWNDNKTLAESDALQGYYVTLVGKTPWQIGPLVRLDTVADEFKRWTVGLYAALPSSPVRFLLNYEYRALRNGMRADDKLYFWTQLQF